MLEIAYETERALDAKKIKDVNEVVPVGDPLTAFQGKRDQEVAWDCAVFSTRGQGMGWWRSLWDETPMCPACLDSLSPA